MDYVSKAPEGFEIYASTENCPVAAFGSEEKGIYGVQFHPEVNHTQFGQQILRNFLYGVCHASGDWTMHSFAQTAVEDIRKKVGNGKVLLALSGGVDSSVVAALMNRAIGKNLICIFVDHGLLRKNEGDDVVRIFGKEFDMNLTRVNAQERFLSKLAGVSEPEKKRKIIGEEFIRVFEEEAKKIGKVEFLAQGTIYPDVVESGAGEAALIKSHHNVGGLPEYVDFEEIIEPLSLIHIYILLQILEDGRLTDSHGRTVDFKNTVIIMTSNIGASRIGAKGKIGFGQAEEDSSGYEHMKENMMEELKRSFRPEFLNRIDDIIVFHKLDEEDTPVSYTHLDVYKRQT